MLTNVLITTTKTVEEALANAGRITADDGVIVLKAGVVQYWIVAGEIKLVARDGDKQLT